MAANGLPANLLRNSRMKQDPTILFVRPQAISETDKTALRAANVIVVEIEDPHAARFVRAGVEISASQMLVAAVQALLKNGYTSDFGALVSKAIIANHQEKD